MISGSFVSVRARAPAQGPFFVPVGSATCILSELNHLLQYLDMSVVQQGRQISVLIEVCFVGQIAEAEAVRPSL
jgi:hypothetical protein